MTMPCAVVDDEPLARRVLERYIADVPSLRLVGQAGDAVEASQLLHAEAVELLFLDVRLPGMSGLQLLGALERPPRVILTTAHLEFAVDGFEHGVVDCLLKPVRFERFLKAVNRALALAQPAAGGGVHVIFREGRDLHRVAVADLRYLEAQGNYVRVVLPGRELLVTDTLSNMEQRLAAHGLVRIHRSYVVNLAHVTRVRPDDVEVAGTVLPLGETFRAEVLRRFR